MLKTVRANFAAQLWSLALAMADRIILVGILIRVWGPNVYADWVILFSAAGLIGMGESGLNIYFGNKWQHAFAHKDETAFRRYVDISLSIYLSISVIICSVILLFVLSGDVAARLSLNAVDATNAMLIFLMLAAANLLIVMRGAISQIYRGRGEFARGILFSSFVYVAFVPLAAIAAQVGAGPLSIAAIYLSAQLLFGTVIMLTDISRRYPQFLFQPRWPTKNEIIDVVNHGKWYGVLQGTPIAWLQIPVLILVSNGLGNVLIVSFVVTRTLVNFSRQLMDIAARSIGVEIAPAYHTGETDLLSARIFYFGRFFSTLSGAITGGLLLFAGPVISLWTGTAELYHPWLVLWLMIPSFALAPAGPLQNILTYGNAPRPIGLVGVAQILVGCSLCYLLSLPFGISGAAAGLAMGQILSLGIVLPILVREHVGINIVRYYGECIGIFGLSGAWCAGAAWCAIALFGAGSFTAFFLSAALWSVLGLLPASAAATPKEYRTKIRGIAYKGLRSWF